MKKEEQRKKHIHSLQKGFSADFFLYTCSCLLLGFGEGVKSLLSSLFARTKLQHFLRLGASSLPSVQLSSGRTQRSLPWCQSRVRHLVCHLKPEYDGSPDCLLHILQTFESLCSQWKEDGHRGSVHFAQILLNFLLKRKKGVYIKDPMLS